MAASWPSSRSTPPPWSATPPWSWLKTSCSCPAWSTPTCTSASPATPSGRASPAPPGPPPRAGSPPWSTCRWTASRSPSASTRCGSSSRPRRARRTWTWPSGPGSSPATRPTSDRWPGPAWPTAAPGYAGYLSSRPRGTENLAIAQVIQAARATGGHAHIVHLSSSDALPMIASARREGVRITAETCPHYLTLTAEEIGDTTAKCSPPVREAANRELLWAGLREQTLAMVVSDHSPCTAPMKAGDWDQAWGGVSSLQLGLPLVWTQARRRGIGLAQVAAWMAAAPARLAGLAAKGRIAPGYDADLCVLAPEQSFVVDPARLHHKHPATTPYAGRTLHGVVRATILRGQLTDPARPRGQLLRRSP